MNECGLIIIFISRTRVGMRGQFQLKELVHVVWMRPQVFCYLGVFFLLLLFTRDVFSLADSSVLLFPLFAFPYSSCFFPFHRPLFISLFILILPIRLSFCFMLDSKEPPWLCAFFFVLIIFVFSIRFCVFMGRADLVELKRKALKLMGRFTNQRVHVLIFIAPLLL